METLSTSPFQSITVQGKLTPTLTVTEPNTDLFPAIKQAFETGERVRGEFHAEAFTGRVTSISFVDDPKTQKPLCIYKIDLDTK